MPHRNFSCETCQILWREYSEATRVALKAAADRQIAELAQDSATLAAIDPDYQNALRIRDTARRAVLDHAASHTEAKAAAAP